MTNRPEDHLIDYDHLELEDPSAQALLSSDALKLGAASHTNLLGAQSNSSTTGFAESNDQR